MRNSFKPFVSTLNIFLGFFLIGQCPMSAFASGKLYFKHESGWMRGDSLTDGTRTHTPNFLGRYQDLEAWVMANPKAAEYARVHMAESHKAIVFAVINFLVTSAGVVTGIATNSGPVLWSTLGVHLILSGFTFAYVSSARTALLDAVNTYNGFQVGFAQPIVRGQPDFQATLGYQFRLGS